MRGGAAPYAELTALRAVFCLSEIMAWWKRIAAARIAWIVVVVTATHLAAAAIILSLSIPPPVFPDQDVVEIVLADLEPAPAPEREPPIETPQPTPEPAIVAPAPSSTPQPTPQTEPRPEPRLATPEVLVQLEPSDGTDVSSQPAPASSTLSDTPLSDGIVTEAQIANVLQKANCLALKRHEDGACPPPDPFDVAIAAEERDVPPEQLYRSDPRYVAQTVDDKMFEAEAAKRFLWPDQDLFNDPMAPGAYNARRIRNGQEPLWSQEIRDGFSKED